MNTLQSIDPVSGQALAPELLRLDSGQPVTRPEHVLVRAQDQHGNAFELQPDGLLAVCIQHEMDHLNGVLFIDHLSRLKRERAVTKVKKAARDRIAA